MKIPSLTRFSKILLTVLIFIVLVLFAAPRIARRYIVRHGRELIGRAISIDRIRVNYFTGTLAIYDLKLFENDTQTIFLSFKKLKVNLDYFPLFRHEIAVKYISLDEPYVEVLQNSSRFNFSDLIKSDTTGTKEDTVPSPPTRYEINNIRISKGYLKYTDQVLNHTIALDSLDLQIPGFTWNSGSTKLDVNFNFVDGGGLYSKLDVSQADSTYLVNLKLDSLNLGIFEPYAKNYLKISGLAGYLSDSLLIKGSLQSILKLSLSGENQIKGFFLKDTLGRTILSADNFRFRIDSFMPGRNFIRLGKVEITNPYVLLELVDSTSNLSSIVKGTGVAGSDTASQPAGGSSTASSFSYNFPRMIITGGKILFIDKTLGYPFEYNINDLSVDLGEASGTSGKLTFRITAGLNGTGTISSQGILDPENFNDLDLALKIGQFRMKDVDAYFRHYFGFPVTGGIMNFSTSNEMRPNSLISDNTIFFRKFKLGEKLQGKSEYRVPLRLAIGILSDKDGVIDLKAPVKMKGEEIKIINLGRIIFKVIGTLFVKAAVAPFNLLAGSSNADAASLQEIRLGFQDPSPDTRNLNSVDIIAGFLNNKPLLDADFIYCINRQKASDTLAYLICLKDYLAAEGSKQALKGSVPDTALIRFLRNKTGIRTGETDSTLQGLCRSYAGVAKVTVSLDSVTRMQTTFMSDYLSKDRGLLPERFCVIKTTPDSILPRVGYPYFRVYFRASQ